MKDELLAQHTHHCDTMRVLSNISTMEVFISTMLLIGQLASHSFAATNYQVSDFMSCLLHRSR